VRKWNRIGAVAAVAISLAGRSFPLDSPLSRTGDEDNEKISCLFAPPFALFVFEIPWIFVGARRNISARCHLSAQAHAWSTCTDVFGGVELIICFLLFTLCCSFFSVRFLFICKYFGLGFFAFSFGVFQLFLWVSGTCSTARGAVFAIVIYAICF